MPPSRTSPKRYRSSLVFNKPTKTCAGHWNLNPVQNKHQNPGLTSNKALANGLHPKAETMQCYGILLDLVNTHNRERLDTDSNVTPNVIYCKKTEQGK
jgi:hypothetical protein